MEQWEILQRRIRRRHKEYNIKINSLASVQKGFHYYHWSSRSIIGRSFMRQKREKEIIWAADPYFNFLSFLRFGTHTEAVREGTLRADMLCYRILLNSSATRFAKFRDFGKFCGFILNLTEFWTYLDNFLLYCWNFQMAKSSCRRVTLNEQRYITVLLTTVVWDLQFARFAR